MEFTSQYYISPQGILQMDGALQVTWKKNFLTYISSQRLRKNIKVFWRAERKSWAAEYGS